MSLSWHYFPLIIMIIVVAHDVDEGKLRMEENENFQARKVLKFKIFSRKLLEFKFGHDLFYVQLKYLIF